MITTGRAAYQKECRYAEYAGLSTDNKLDPAIAPVLQNGDTFKEIDTGATFKYNAASGQWVEQPASGGGGGTPGPAGQNGATFTPSVSEAGVLSWTNNGGLDNPDPVNIMGPQGPQGVQGNPGAQGAPGAAGADGQDGGYYQPSVATDGTLSWTASVSSMPSVASVNIRGPQGPAGADGAPGANGQDGAPGAQGPAGQGVPTGGTTGQVLAKSSDEDYATQWIDVTAPDVQIASATELGCVKVGTGLIIEQDGSLEATAGLYRDAASGIVFVGPNSSKTMRLSESFQVLYGTEYGISSDALDPDWSGPFYLNASQSNTIGNLTVSFNENGAEFTITNAHATVAYFFMYGGYNLPTT